MISNDRIPTGVLGLNGGTTFSADVKLHLYIGEQRIELGQLGPGFAILRDAQAIEASEGELETVIDKKVTRCRIRIVSPITIDSQRFSFEPIGRNVG